MGRQVLSAFRFMGWELGPVEAVTMSILVGTGVDYVVHMVEAFSLTKTGSYYGETYRIPAPY